VSFDPHNPRGAPRPPQPPANNPVSNYIPPQPVNPGPSRMLIAGGAAIGILVVGILILLGLNLLNTPAASLAPSATAPVASTPAPTGAGSPRASSVPSNAPPTNVASRAPATPLGSPPTGFDAFLLHVPEALRASCVLGDNATTFTFSATCTTSDGIVVTYAEYPDSTSMDSAYEDAFAQVQIDPGTGSCEDYGTWPAEGPYEVAGEAAGRRLCSTEQGSPTIYWTDDRLAISASATGSDPVRLVQFWTNEAGPVQ